MLIFCLIALMLGGVLAAAIPVLHLSLGLAVLTILGMVEAFWLGAPLIKIFLWSGALFGSAQVGYVMGAAVLAFIGTHRAKNSTAANATRSPGQLQGESSSSRLTQ
jgi:hypothetical protein